MARRRPHWSQLAFHILRILHILHSCPTLDGRKEPPMTALSHRRPPPTAEEAAIARASSQQLSRFAGRNRPLTLRVGDAQHEQPLELPAGAVALLMEVLEAMAAGRGVTIIPENAELTTVQAADILNVSRPFLIKLLDDGALALPQSGQAPPHPHRGCRGLQEPDRSRAGGGARRARGGGAGTGHGL